MAHELRGKTAIVTGGGRGFGRAIALRLAAEGAKVAVTSRSLNQLNETVGQIQAAGGDALAIAGDVTNREDVARVVATTEEHFGPVSILVSNAGVSGPYGPIWYVDPDAWWSAQEVHLRGMLLFTRAVLPGMVERRGGRIVTVSALASTRVEPNMSAYAVAKSAQVRVTQHIAEEVKEFGVFAFAIEPGTVYTDLAQGTIDDPDARRWRPAMIERLTKLKAEANQAAGLAKCAHLCLRLASGECDILSGQYIDVREDLDEKLRQAIEGRRTI
jgi:NAD(P)-dependent dehydrogenase (short-subunit alcohol dehydrogenase family)